MHRSTPVSRRFATTALAVAALSTLTIAVSVHPSFAQQGGQGRRGGRGGFGRGGMAPTATTFTYDQLKKALSLTVDQDAKIKPGFDAYTKQMADMAAARQAAQNGGAQPDRQAMMQKFQAMRTAGQTVDSTIDSTLTSDQKDKLRDLIKSATLFQKVGLPAGAAAEFTPTDDETKALQSLGDDVDKQQREAQNGGQRPDFQAMRQQQEDNRTKALAALTPEHKATVDTYMKAHPQQQFGGGFGGGGGRRNRGGAAPGGAPPAQQ